MVELLIVILVLSALVVLSVLVVDPVKQFNRARDGNRKQDLVQVRSALDTYYNDKKAYPPSFSFSGSFTNNSVLYQKSVPNDPITSSTIPYQYEIDFSSSRPQWVVLYARLAAKPSATEACPLEQFTNCVPTNYASLGYNYCVLLGDPDCSVISGYTFPAVVPTVVPTATVVPTVTPLPTQSCPPSQATYSCTVGGIGSCNVVPAGQGKFCGFPGCSGDACCNNTCL